MIKIEAETNQSGNIVLTVTSRDTDSASLEELDKVFRAVASVTPRRAGYTSSTSFVVEVREPDTTSVGEKTESQA